MFHPLRRYISSHATTTLTDDQFQHILETMREKTYRKKQSFLQEGDVCKYFGFIVEGSMLQYSVDDRGFEHILRLSLENSWVGDRESWVMLTPTIYNIDAWEHTKLLLITKEETIRLAREIPAYDEMVRAMDEKHLIASQKRVNAAISFPANKRYSDFADNHPELIQRFPQHIIASYLGVTKETLSRIRRHTLRASGGC